MLNDRAINTLNNVDSQLYSLFFNGLTSCELQVLPFIFHEVPMKIISYQLNVKDQTIANRLGSIYKKLGVFNQVELRHLIAHRRDEYEFFQRNQLIVNQEAILEKLSLLCGK